MDAGIMPSNNDGVKELNIIPEFWCSFQYKKKGRLRYSNRAVTDSNTLISAAILLPPYTTNLHVYVCHILNSESCTLRINQINGL